MPAVSPRIAFRVLYQPAVVFGELTASTPSAAAVFFRIALWLLLVPPVCAYIGSLTFGWQLGAGEPVFVEPGAMVGVALAYFVTLIFGFVSVAVVAQWMAQTYGARSELGIHFALVVLVGTPMLLGGVIHLYPHAFVNLLVLTPALIWSMYLLYRGLPVLLGIDSQRGMLMASALIAYLLVAAVSLLGLTVVLWGQGIGPRLGV